MAKLPPILAVSACALLVACAPAHFVRLQRPAEADKAEVLIHRGSAFQASGSSLILRVNESDVVELYGSRYSVIHLPAGEHRFSGRSSLGDQPFELKVKVTSSHRTCIEVVPNPANLAKALVPISYLMGNTFLLKPGACPTSEQLARYQQVPVRYQGE